MASAQEYLARGVESTKELVNRYLKGFTDQNRAAQAPTLPNHVAWSLGHLAHTMHRVAGFFDGGPLPPEVFIEGATKGDANRFATECVCFGSTPSGDVDEYPALARCVEVFEGGCDRLARAIRASKDADLDRGVPWGAGQQTLGMLVFRMVFHNGMHTGQIADLRRALRLGSIM